jgi:hypothetical protein
MGAYADYVGGKLVDQAYEDRALAESIEALPEVAAE